MNTPSLPSDWRERISRYRSASGARWLRIAAYIWVAITALVLIAAVTIVALLGNASFHSYVIRAIESNASESLGVPVHLENFALHLSTLSADVYGITVDGASPYTNRPLLQVDHAEAGVRIVSVIHRAWYLDNVRIDRPIVRVFVDEHGVSNLPIIQSNNSSSNTSVFDLGIRHALIDQGEVYYNDKPSILSVDLRNLIFKSSFAFISKQYSGSLTYSDGHIVYGAFQPLTHDLNAHFQATPTSFSLTDAALTLGSTKALLSVNLDNYTNPHVRGRYDLTIDGSQVAHVLNNPSIPVGTIHTVGSIEYLAAAGQSALESLTIIGELNSHGLDLNTSAAHTHVGSIAGHYSLLHGDAMLRDFYAQLLGGEVVAQGKMTNVAGNSDGDFTATLRNISLSDATAALAKSASAQPAAVLGKLNANAKVTWNKSLQNLIAETNATVQANVSSALKISRNIHGLASINLGAPNSLVPVNATINAKYVAKTGEVTLTKSHLNTSQTELSLNGKVSNHSSLNVQLQAHDLREIETVANLFRPSSPQHPAQPLGLGGAAVFQGTVRGSINSPHLVGQFTATNLQFNGTTLKTVRTGVDASPTMVSLQEAYAELSSHGHITFSATAGLSKWSFTSQSAIRMTMQATELNIADLLKLAGQQVPISGTLNAGLNLQGTELNPMGNGSVTLTGVTAYEQPIQSAKLTFSGNGKDVSGNLAVQLPAGVLRGSGTVQPEAKTYSADIHVNGLQLDKLQAVQAKKMDVKGTLSLNASSHGTFDNPGLDATLTIPTLVAQAQTISNIDLYMNVANHVATAALTSSAVNTSIQAKATVHLSGDYQSDASLDTQGIPLQPLLAVYAPDQVPDIDGETEIHATLHGPLKKNEKLEAHLNIPLLRVAYGKNIQLAAEAPIRADYKNSVVTLQHSSIKGTDTDLEFQGSIPTVGDGPMSLLLRGKVNLQLAQLFDPDIRTSGELRFNIDSNGPMQSADIGGQIDVVDVNFASADLPIGLQHGNGVLKVTKDRVNIANFQGTVGGETITAQGGVAYRPSLQFDMGMIAKGIRILYPQGMRESIDANLRLAGTTDNAQLGGSVNLSDLSFTSAFDLSSFIAQFSGGVEPPPSLGFANNLQLNLAVRSTNTVNLVSRSLSVAGNANLQVRGTATNPVILGRVNLNDGDIILNGNRFVLTGGTIQFINPAETQPVVNLALNTNIQQYSIDIRFEGPVDQLRTQYNSDPALPSADIINLLAFGETTEASAENPTPTNQAAESLVASQVSSEVTSRVSKIAGISQLSISPVLAGSSSQGPPGAVITIQQRVTANLFVNFSTNVASTQSQTIQGQYRVSPHVSVSATRDANGGFGFDTLIKKSW